MIITARKFCETRGYTMDQVRGKIAGGKWLLGDIVHKAPDGGILIDEEAYERWVKAGTKQAMRIGSRSRS